MVNIEQIEIGDCVEVLPVDSAYAEDNAFLGKYRVLGKDKADLKLSKNFDDYVWVHISRIAAVAT